VGITANDAELSVLRILLFVKQQLDHALKVNKRVVVRKIFAWASWVVAS